MVSLDLFRKLFALSFMVCVLGVSLPAGAATAIDSACDPIFLDRMRERAWGEAQREMMTNQKMIWKPDSVLALGCYEKWIDNLRSNLKFTKDSGSNLNPIVTFTKNTYLKSSFDHNFGGGALGMAPTNNCDNILRLWEASLCNNLTLASFISLGDASTNSNDPRKKPKSGSCSNVGASWGATKLVMQTKGANASFNSMDIFTKIVAPLSETTPVKCSPGIPTGVMLNGGSNPEVVCPNPGCSPDGKATPKCCKSGTTTSCS